MLTFIVLLISGLIIAFFAGQNTTPVTILLSRYQLPTLPLYMVIIGAMLIGFIISWVVSLIEGMFQVFVLRGKENIIKEDKKKFDGLNERIHELELENARLKREDTEPVITEEAEPQEVRPTPFNRLRHAIH